MSELTTEDIKTIRKVVEALKKRKIVGEPPTLYWDFDEQCVKEIPNE